MALVNRITSGHGSNKMVYNTISRVNTMPQRLHDVIDSDRQLIGY